MAEQPHHDETQRDRVRRILIEPLTEAGFRFPKGTDDEGRRKALDRIADSLAYLGDSALDTLRAALVTKGEGAARCFWPSYATIAGLAEAFQSRPIEDVPEVARWFGSAAGRAALAGDRLVAEFEFWERKKRPPLSRQETDRVAQRAREQSERAARIRDRIRRGLPPLFDVDGEWLSWYDATRRRAEALVNGVRA